jgi:hypothetical protein
MLKVNKQMMPYVSAQGLALINYLRTHYNMDEDLAVEIAHLKLPEDIMYDLPEEGDDERD